MPAGPIPFVESTVPHPKRFWWLARLSTLACVLVAATVGVRWWWGEVAQRRVDAVIAGAQARGEPILASDYASNSVTPDATNAAFYLRRAGMALKYTPTEEWAVDNAERLPVPPDVAEVAEEVVKRYRAPLADVREARRHAGTIDWALPIRSPMWNVLLRDLNHLRDLCRLTRAAAVLAAQRGDHAAALEHCQGLRFIARAANQQPFLVAQRFTMFARLLALTTLTEITADIPLDDAAVRESIRAMIPELLDEQADLAAFQDALRGDRAMHLDAGQALAAAYPVMRPALQFDALRLVAQDDAVIAAAGAPTWPAAMTAVPARPKFTGPRHHARFVGNLFTAAWEDKDLLTRSRLSAHARLAATALAVRLYQHDHAGQRPPTLDALVPDYLPAIARDPLAPGSQPIRYVSDGASPYLYTVGEHGIDDTATGWRPSATDLMPLMAKDGFVELVPRTGPRIVTTRPAPETP